MQIHAANGYLIDQFLRDNANFRDDAYGGSIENRIRLLREVTQAVAEAVGADRTGVRLSPNGESQGVNDSDPEPCSPPPRPRSRRSASPSSNCASRAPTARSASTDVPRSRPPSARRSTAPLVLNSDFDGRDGAGGARRRRGRRDRLRPDVPRQSRPAAPPARAARRSTPDDAATWYSQGPEGYTDYPFAEGTVAA